MFENLFEGGKKNTPPPMPAEAEAIEALGVGDAIREHLENEEETGHEGMENPTTKQ